MGNQDRRRCGTRESHARFQYKTLTSIAALASLRRRSRLLLSSGSDVSAFSCSRSASRPRLASSNAALELFLCPRFLAADAARISAPSTGVIGVRPLLESPVELAGLFPRRATLYVAPANGFGGGVAIESKVA